MEAADAGNAPRRPQQSGRCPRGQVDVEGAIAPVAARPGPPKVPGADRVAPGVAFAAGAAPPDAGLAMDDGAAKVGRTLTCTAANPTTNRLEIRILFLGELGARFGREHVLESAEVLTVREVRRRLGDQVEGSAAGGTGSPRATSPRRR